jgi:lycopene cyclase domain-containing protein
MDYLFWLAISVWLPAGILWAYLKRPMEPKLKATFRLAIITVISYLPVEYLTLRYPMVMGEGHYLGIRLLTFPLEDFLFFLTIPFLVVGIVYFVDDRIFSK